MKTLTRAGLKFLIGTAVFLIGGVLIWGGYNSSGSSYATHQIGWGEISWKDFPVISGSSSTLPMNSPHFILVYSPGDCNSCLDQKKEWRLLAEQHGIGWTAVLKVEGMTAGRRYLNLYPNPYTTRLDSTGWFVDKFELSTMPAIILMSDEGEAIVIYPEKDARSTDEKLRLLGKM